MEEEETGEKESVEATESMGDMGCPVDRESSSSLNDDDDDEVVKGRYADKKNPGKTWDDNAEGFTFSWFIVS